MGRAIVWDFDCNDVRADIELCDPMSTINSVAFTPNSQARDRMFERIGSFLETQETLIYCYGLSSPWRCRKRRVPYSVRKTLTRLPTEASEHWYDFTPGDLAAVTARVPR